MSIKVVPVDELPVTIVKPRKNLKKYVEEFRDSDHKFARVDFSTRDYSSLSSCISAFRNACIVYGDRKVDMTIRNGEVYFIKAERYPDVNLKRVQADYDDVDEWL